jgi:hypothetical protein
MDGDIHKYIKKHADLDAELDALADEDEELREIMKGSKGKKGKKKNFDDMDDSKFY